MKPSLNRAVYCIYEDSILTEEVYALGADSFIVASFGSMTNSDSWEYFFEEYNETWFTSLARAKKKLKAKYHREHGKSCTFVEIESGYYEAIPEK